MSRLFEVQFRVISWVKYLAWYAVVMIAWIRTL